MSRVDGDGDGTVTCDIGAYEVPFFLAPSLPVPLAPALPALLAAVVGAWGARQRVRTADRGAFAAIVRQRAGSPRALNGVASMPGTPCHSGVPSLERP